MAAFLHQNRRTHKAILHFFSAKDAGGYANSGATKSSKFSLFRPRVGVASGIFGEKKRAKMPYGGADFGAKSGHGACDKTKIAEKQNVLFMIVVKSVNPYNKSHARCRQKTVPEEGKSHVAIGIFHFFTCNFIVDHPAAWRYTISG